MVDDFFIKVGAALVIDALVIDAVSMETGLAHSALAALKNELRTAEALWLLKSASSTHKSLLTFFCFFKMSRIVSESSTSIRGLST